MLLSPGTDTVVTFCRLVGVDVETQGSFIFSRSRFPRRPSTPQDDHCRCSSRFNRLVVALTVVGLGLSDDPGWRGNGFSGNSGRFSANTPSRRHWPMASKFMGIEETDTHAFMITTPYSTLVQTYPP